MKLLDRSVVLIADVQECVDHLGEQLRAGRDLLEAEDRGEAGLAGTNAHLRDEVVHPLGVDPLVLLGATADPDDLQGEPGPRRQHVRYEVDLAGRERGTRRELHVEPRGGIVPSVRDEHEVPLDALGSHPEEIGADGERVPDGGTTAGGEQRDQVLDVREVLAPDIRQRDADPDRFRERDETEERAGRCGVLQYPEDGRPGDLDLLPLGLTRRRVRQRREHALGQVQEQHVPLPGRHGS